MKKQSLLFYLLFMAAALSAQVPTNGLVGYFPFNGNANDLSTIANNGSVSGATLTTDRFGNANNAYSFNGTTDYIVIPHSNAYNNQYYTISFWFKFSTSSTFGGGGFNVNPGIVSKVNSSANVTYDNWVFYEGQGQIGFTSGVAGASGGGGTPASGQNDGQWRHIVVSVASDSIRTYLNGIKVSASIKGSNLVFNSLPIYLGRSNASYWKAYQGILDDLAIWNRALSQQEVTALYNSCVNTTATISPQSSTIFCQGGSVVLQASAGSSYNWSNGASTQSITANQSNTYTVTVTDGNGCTATASQAVTVNPNPVVSFSLPAFTNNNAAAFTLNGNPSGGSYTGAGVSGNSFNPSASGLGLKNITYSFTNGNGCSGTATASTIVYDTTGVVCTSYDTVTTTVNDTVTTYLSVTDTLKINVQLTGVNPPLNTNTIKVYPNPASTHLLIDNGNLQSMAGYSIKITNTLGQIVFNQAVNQQSFFIDLSTWGGSGTYLLYVIDAQQNVKEIKKIVLQ